MVPQTIFFDEVKKKNIGRWKVKRKNKAPFIWRKLAGVHGRDCW